MSKENYKNYFNGGCSTCMFAKRDERGRYIGSCSGFSNCSYEEYKGKTDIKEEKDNKIADLEAKLAESESKSYTLESYNNFLNNQCKKFIKENKQLKQQLAEKEKKLAEYKRVCTIAHVEDLQIENMLLKGKDQDKISFAVEQLNQFKSELVNKVSPVNLSYTEYVQEVFKKIDNQIKMLKEGK